MAEKAIKNEVSGKAMSPTAVTRHGRDEEINSAMVQNIAPN